MTDNLSIPRSELQQCIDHARAIQATIQEILDRPAPPSRGHIDFRDAVIELPDDGGDVYDPRD